MQITWPTKIILGFVISCGKNLRDCYINAPGDPGQRVPGLDSVELERIFSEDAAPLQHSQDGAVAMVVMSESRAAKLGVTPLGRMVSYAWAGVEPELMGYGPVPVARKALAKTGLTMGTTFCTKAGSMSSFYPRL